MGCCELQRQRMNTRRRGGTAWHELPRWEVSAEVDPRSALPTVAGTTKASQQTALGVVGKPFGFPQAWLALLPSGGPEHDCNKMMADAASSCGQAHAGGFALWPRYRAHAQSPFLLPVTCHGGLHCPTGGAKARGPTFAVAAISS